MREIKFRAWDTRKRKWKGIWIFRGGHIGEKSHYDKPEIFELGKSFDDYVVFMQYTGLKDINEEEIYEGDICLMQLKDTVVEGKIKYHSPCFVLNTNSDSWDLDNYYSIKIIGNIYENPELLKEKT